MAKTKTEKTKADYYDWLMKKHDVVTNQRKMSLIPKIPLEDQAKKCSTE